MLAVAQCVYCRRVAALVCSRGTLKRFTFLKTAMSGKGTALVGELVMVLLPSRLILLPSWGCFLGLSLFSFPFLLLENLRHPSFPSATPLRLGGWANLTNLSATSSVLGALPLVAMPFVTSRFLLLVVRPGAPSSVLCSVRSDAPCYAKVYFKGSSSG